MFFFMYFMNDMYFLHYFHQRKRVWLVRHLMTESASVSVIKDMIAHQIIGAKVNSQYTNR